MTDDDFPRPPIRLILDTSTVAGYGVNLSVGALLAEFTEDEPGAVFAVTTGTLAQTYGAGIEPAALNLLLGHPSLVVLSPFADWIAFGAYLREFPADNVHDANLVWLAFSYGAYIFTGSPETYLAIDPDAPVLELADPFDES